MKLLNKKLNRMQWINKGILFFILLFTFEPILSSSNIYWYLLAVSASIVFLIFIGFILGIFIKKTIPLHPQNKCEKQVVITTNKNRLSRNKYTNH